MSAHRLAYPLLALMVVGCSGGDNLPRQPVAGNVTMDDRPLPEGAIMFSPTGETKVTAAVATIKDGQFSIPTAEGLVPGAYRVSISHAEVIEVNPKKGQGALSKTTKLGKELIPARYNTQSKLTAEIKAGGAKDLKFELQSK